MITLKTLETTMCEAMRRAAVTMPPDVAIALRRALDEETDPIAQEHLRVSLENARLAAEGKGLVCGDTGFPLYFVTAGADTRIEGGFGAVWTAAERATARATAEAFLRPTMVDPISRDNPGDNLGPGMPKVELNFQGRGAGLEIVAAPKGGGSEIFGTFYRMLYPSDGMEGVKAFALDCVRESCYAGKICPPAIVGLGVGGSADLCVKMAKEAAVLCPVGSRSEDPRLAALEEELLAASRSLGIGPMGSRGVNAVLAFRVKIAMTHTAALPVAFNAQCLIGRRWKATIAADETVAYSGDFTRCPMEARR